MISQLIISKIIEDFRNISTISDISKKYGISKNSVRKFLTENINSSEYKDLMEKIHRSRFYKDYDNVVNDYKSGISVVELSKKYNISVDSLYGLFRRLMTKKERVDLKLNFKTYKFIDKNIDRNQEIINFYLDGITYDSIAEKYNLTKQNISLIIKKRFRTDEEIEQAKFISKQNRKNLKNQSKIDSVKTN